MYCRIVYDCFGSEAFIRAIDNYGPIAMKLGNEISFAHHSAPFSFKKLVAASVIWVLMNNRTEHLWICMFCGTQ